MAILELLQGENQNDACFPDSIVGFHSSSKVTTEYIQEWLSFLQPAIEANAPQVAQKNINLQILKELNVAVPPIDLQREYSEFVNKLHIQQEKQNKHFQQLENLFNELVQKGISPQQIVLAFKTLERRLITDFAVS